MIKKTITYTDFNEVERTEDFYFNLSKSELITMEKAVSGGLANKLEKIVGSKDEGQMIQIFKEIILDSYGEKSPDGKRFIKSKALSEAFEQTEAYNLLFMELASNSEAAAAFINGVIPSGNPIVPIHQ